MAILVLATIETTILTSKGGQMAAEGRALPPTSVPYSTPHIQSVCTVGTHCRAVLLYIQQGGRTGDDRPGPGMTHLRTGNDPCWGGSHWPDGAGQVVLCRR